MRNAAYFLYAANRMKRFIADQYFHYASKVILFLS